MIDKDKLENDFIKLCDDKSFDKLVRFINFNKDNIDIDVGFTWACAYNHTKVAKYLLKEHNANIHAKENYAIRWSCTKEFNDLAKYLLFSDELKENASVKVAFLISLEFNKPMLNYLICETNKETREIIQQAINENSSATKFKDSQQLLDKMNLVDNLSEELPSHLETNKKNKI